MLLLKYDNKLNKIPQQEYDEIGKKLNRSPCSVLNKI